MLFYIALIASLLALGVLAFSSVWGVIAIFLVRPLVDATWNQPVMLGLKLTEIVSGIVPLMICLRMLLSRDPEQSLRRMPLKNLWLVWIAYAAVFSTSIAYTEDLVSGLNIFMRYANGFAGFYMVQAFFAGEKQTRLFVWTLMLAGIFPMTTGLIEALTGVHWRVTYGEDGIVRGVGFYHDAITIRYYALQTIMGLLLFCGLYLQRRTLMKGLSLAYGAVAALVIQRTYSKAGLLTFGSWMFLWPFLQKKYKTLGVLAVVAVLGVGWYADRLMAEGGFIFHKELAAIQGQGGVQRTFAGRWYLWDMMMAQWQSFGLFAKLFGSGHVALGAHNDYLQALFHGGIVGLLLYLALLFVVFGRIVRDLIVRIDALGVAALLAIIMWMVDSIGLVPSAYPGYQWFVWGVIGLSLRKRQDESQVRAVRSPVQQVESRAAVASTAVLVPVHAGATLARNHPPAFLNLPIDKSAPGSSG